MINSKLNFLLLFKQGGGISQSCSSATPCEQYTQHTHIIITYYLCTNELINYIIYVQINCTSYSLNTLHIAVVLCS